MAKEKSKIKIGNVKGDVVISQDQSGGTTAHKAGVDANKKAFRPKWSIIITVITVLASIAAILTYLDVNPFKENKMPKDEKKIVSIGDVNGDVVISQDQSGGITAHTVSFTAEKIDTINILTDKESLGIREPDGLYQNGKRLGQ